jgi:hypothetical protein
MWAMRASTQPGGPQFAGEEVQPGFNFTYVVWLMTGSPALARKIGMYVVRDYDRLKDAAPFA